MKRSLLFVVAVAGSLGAAGCSGAGGEIGSSIGADTATSALAQEVVGTWSDASYSSDTAPFQTITFTAAGTYSGVAPGRGGAQFVEAISGTFTVSESGPQLGAPGGAPQLNLTDANGNETSYFASVTESGLVLSATYGLNATDFTFAPQTSAGVDAGADAAQDAGDSAASGLAQEVVGTWTDASYSTDTAPFQTITLTSAGTYSGYASGRGGAHFVEAISGTFTVGLSGPQLGAPGGAPQLDLTDANGNETSYFASVTGAGLVLSTTYGLNATYFTFGPAGSDAGEDAGEDAAD